MSTNTGGDLTTAQLPDNPSKTTLILWIVVLCILALIVIVFGVLAFQSRTATKGVDAALLGIATTALGGLIGLLAPNPKA